MRPFLWLFALALASVSPAAAQQPHLDPVLRMLLRPEVRDAAQAGVRPAIAPPERPALAGLVALDAEGPGGGARVGVLVHLRTPGALAELQAAGAQVGVVVGDVATARVPLTALPVLAALTGLERVEAAQVVRRTNDLAAALVRADRVRSRVDQAWQGFAGQGVIVGVYDSGLDYTHPDFRDAEGRTRLLGLWDQTVQGAPPPGFPTGFYCDVPSLDAATCPQQDRDGHGTHVAGSAAGNGRAVVEPLYAGIAPAASLLIVKGGDGSFAEDRIIEGIAWMFSEAARLGRPAVVNLSLGGQFGPHDGTRNFERAIDNLSGPGRIVVAAAGNDGASPAAPGTRTLIHATAIPVQGATSAFTIAVPTYTPSPGVRDDHVRMNLWYAGADRLTIAVVRPDGSRVAAAYGQFTRNLAATGGVEIFNAQDGADPVNGDNPAFILIENLAGSGPPATGTWTIEFTATAPATGRPLHLWIYSNDLGETGASGVQGFANSHLVGSPGTARRAVTVGAYVSRLRWTSADGNTYGFGRTDEAPGDIATFSSVGPTRDGRLKPEITAPGRIVISSLSAASTYPGQLIVPGGRHLALQGTSMAAPMVAGGVALLLQRAPSLTPETVKQILAATAIRDPFTQRSYVPGDPGGPSNFTWGHGKLDVEASLAGAAAFARAAVLGVTAVPIEVPGTPPSERGTRIPFLRFTLTADGPEAIDVAALGFRVTGTDPGAALLLFRDVQGDGAIGGQDPLVGSQPAPLTPGDTLLVTVPLTLRVPAGQTVSVIAALELSGAVPHRAPFRAAFDPAATRAVGVQTGEQSPLRQPSAVVRTGEFRPTLLAAGEAFALSENPVRSPQVIFNFRTRPTMAAIYTVSGRQVVDLVPLLENNVRVVWNLTNQQGIAVAPGVYLAVFQIGGETVRERLIIVRPTDGRE